MNSPSAVADNVGGESGAPDAGRWIGVGRHRVAHRDANTGDWPVSLSEVSIAADRFRPHRVVAASMSSGSDGRIVTVSSDDGGANWSYATVLISSGASYHADPMVTFDSRGVAHLVHIPVDGSIPLGIEVNRSLDGGRTWSRSLRISRTRDDDKTIILADDNPESPRRDNVYVAWKLPSGGVFFSFSDDQGLTYTAARRIASAAVSGLDLAIAPNGAVFLAANSGSRGEILFFRSLDGGLTFEAPREVASVRAGWYTTTPSICTRMALVHASIDIDRSEGADRGNLYITWSDHPPGVSSCQDFCSSTTACSADVYISRSVDNGETWSTPTQVHEATVGTSDQYHQWLGVDPLDGAVYVAYKDTRDDVMRYSTHVYLSRSVDGGLTFEPSMRLSSAPSLADNRFQYGDYQSLSVAGGLVYTAWADFRASSRQSQIYVGRTDFRDLGAAAVAEPPRLDLEERVGRVSAPRIVTVRNEGTDDLRIFDIRLRGADRSQFRLPAAGDRCSQVLLAPGELCRFRVRFAPEAVGLKRAMAIFSSTDADEQEIRILPRGTGI